MPYNPQTGDILLFAAEDIIGEVIVGVTGGNRSHAGIVVVESRPWYIGAEESGVVAQPLENTIKLWKSIKVRRVRFIEHPYEPPDNWQVNLGNAAMNAVGIVKYSYGKLFADLYEQVADPSLILNSSTMPNRVICAEFASILIRLYRNYIIIAGSTDAGVTPNDLDQTYYLNTVCEELCPNETRNN